MAEDFLHPQQAAQRQRSLILRFVRLSFVVLIVTVVLVTIINEASAPGTISGVGTEVAWYTPLIAAVILSAVAFLIDVLTPNKKIASLSGVLLGLLAGLLGAVAASYIVDLVLSVTLPPQALVAFKATIGLIKLMIGLCLCYLGIVTVLQTQDDFRLVIPYVEFAKQIRGVKPFILDTSALIDARIVDVAATGLIQSPIIVPRFVLIELQQLADSRDKLKRARGRRGLEIVTRLQRQGRIDVTIDDSPVTAISVDQMLVELATQLSGRIVTTDHGLSRIGQIHGIIVLNLHEIAATFRPALIPGEQIMLRLVKAGEQAGQGVGYLDDGTMVVVDHGAARIGDEVPALVSSTLQTSAGRMVFAKLLEVARGTTTTAVGPTTGDTLSASSEPGAYNAHAQPWSTPIDDDDRPDDPAQALTATPAAPGLIAHANAATSAEGTGPESAPGSEPSSGEPHRNAELDRALSGTPSQQPVQRAAPPGPPGTRRPPTGRNPRR